MTAGFRGLCLPCVEYFGVAVYFGNINNVLIL